MISQSKEKLFGGTFIESIRTLFPHVYFQLYTDIYMYVTIWIVKLKFIGLYKMIL